jgi:hypothetical protein
MRDERGTGEEEGDMPRVEKREEKGEVETEESGEVVDADRDQEKELEGVCAAARARKEVERVLAARVCME